MREGKGEREIGNVKVMRRSTKTDNFNKKEQETEEKVRKICKRGTLIGESRERKEKTEKI